MKYLHSCFVVLTLLIVGCAQPPQRTVNPPKAPKAPPTPAADTVEEDNDRVVSAIPQFGEKPPKIANFGYSPPPRAEREKILQKLGVRNLRQEAPQLFDNDEKKESRVLPTSLKQAEPKEAVLLYRALYEVVPGWKVGKQGIGDCVSWGYANASDILLAVDFKLGKSGQWKPAATEAIYGGSRVEGRGRPEGSGGWSDGSWGTAAATWLTKYGVVYREPFTAFGYDLTNYSADRAKQWGNYGCGGKGDNGRLDSIAKTHPVRHIALVTSFEEAAAAIENGYPVPVCSMQGFSSRRDKNGFAAPSGTWAHCMNFIGVRYNPPGLLCQNSWGAWNDGGVWPDDQPAGSFWVDAKTATSMLNDEDSFALSSLEGFPKRELRHTDGW